MDDALKRKIAEYADKAYAAAHHTSTQQTALKIAESKARLASRGLILSGNTVYEVARLQGEHINTVVQAKAEALLDAYELYGADIDDSILEAATALKATLLDSISAYPASGLPPGVPAFEQFRPLLETNTGAILNTIACQIEQRRVIPKLRTTGPDRSFAKLSKTARFSNLRMPHQFVYATCRCRSRRGRGAPGQNRTGNLVWYQLWQKRLEKALQGRLSKCHKT